MVESPRAAPEEEAGGDRSGRDRSGAGPEPDGLLSRRVPVPRWGIGLALLLFTLLLLILASALDRDDTHIAPFELGSFTDLMPSIAGLTQSHVLAGNSVEVIQDAAFFDRLIADVDAARETVHFETYVWWRGEVCRRLAEAFVHASERGVEVRLVLDAWGARSMDQALRQRMTGAGVEIADYHDVGLDHLGRLYQRDHRKAAILDGRTGYVFGHGVAEEWDQVGTGPWQDTALRIRGPLVAPLQGVFLESWMKTTGQVPAGPAVFPELEASGSVRGHVVASSNTATLSTVRLLYKLAIASAREEILIQNPYFAPDSGVVDLLSAAAERGVRVRLMLPGEEATDQEIVYHAGHTRYRELLDAGVEILEYRPTLLHKKIMVVDRLWSHVGSTNFDSRSLEINDELSVGVLDPRTAELLADEFAFDAESCRRVDPESWHRSWLHRLLDRAVATLQEQL